MRGVPVIRVISAIVLLIVFAFSNTSKQVLHDLLADHSDFTGICTEPCENHIEATGIDCKCAHFVAELPYVPGEAVCAIGIDRHYAPWNPNFVPTYYYRHRSFAEQRGPPAFALGLPVANAYVL